MSATISLVFLAPPGRRVCSLLAPPCWVLGGVFADVVAPPCVGVGVFMDIKLGYVVG